MRQHQAGLRDGALLARWGYRPWACHAWCTYIWDPCWPDDSVVRCIWPQPLLSCSVLQQVRQTGEHSLLCSMHPCSPVEPSWSQQLVHSHPQESLQKALLQALSMPITRPDEPLQGLARAWQGPKAPALASPASLSRQRPREVRGPSPGSTPKFKDSPYKATLSALGAKVSSLFTDAGRQAGTHAAGRGSLCICFLEGLLFSLQLICSPGLRCIVSCTVGKHDQGHSQALLSMAKIWHWPAGEA